MINAVAFIMLAAIYSCCKPHLVRIVEICYAVIIFNLLCFHGSHCQNFELIMCNFFGNGFVMICCNVSENVCAVSSSSGLYVTDSTPTKV